MNDNQQHHPPSLPSPEPRWLFPTLDAALGFAAFALGYIARYDLQILRPVFDPNRSGFAPYIPYGLIYILLIYLSFQGSGLYRALRGRSFMEEVSVIINGVARATFVLLSLFFLFQPLVFSRLMLLYVAVITIGLLALARIVRRMVLAHLRNRGVGVQRVLLVGVGDAGQAILRSIVARKELGYAPVGYIDDNPERGSVNIGRVIGLGGLDNLSEAIGKHNVELVIITLRWKHHDRIMQIIDTCRKSGVDVRVVPDVFQLNLRQVQVENLDGIPLLGVTGSEPLRGTNRLLKRAIDVGLIVLALPILIPLILLIALAIRLESPGAVFYHQRRVGENGKPFNMLKFRSMIPGADEMHAEIVKASGEDPRHPKLKDDPRITRVGKFLRQTSLDELPNIFNVVRGQMSLVGPRPPTPDEVELYESWQMQRLKTIPGMTGLWQVSGRSDVPFEEMCLLDIYYIENWSIKLDAQILMMTLPRVLLRSGAY